jgi:hypothetical protein
VSLNFVIIGFPFEGVGLVSVLLLCRGETLLDLLISDFLFYTLLCRGEALLDLVISDFLFILVSVLPLLCLPCEDLFGLLDEEGLLD